jgi:bifunctional non-homologous end joining protein LigD
VNPDTAPNQLELPIPDARRSNLPSRIRAAQPAEAAAPFDDSHYLFEPWWPGLRALAFVEGGRLRLQAEGLADADAAFGELGVELPGQLMADATVLDGTLLVLDETGHLDAALLRARLHGGRRAGRPAFVASDLLWSGGESWTARRFAARRERLSSVLVDGDRAVVGRALVGEGTLLAEALARMGIEAMSARRLDARYRAGSAGEGWLRVPISAAEPSMGRPTLALLQRLPLA